MAAVIREIRNAERWSQEWECLEEEIAQIKKNQYQKLQNAMDEYRAAQETLKKGLDGSEKKLKAFALSLKNILETKLFDIDELVLVGMIEGCKKERMLRKDNIQKYDKDCDKDEALSMTNRINSMTQEFDYLKQGLPKKPGWFLRACLGSINVSLYWDKLHYKNNYENFKLRMTWLSMLLTFCNLLVFQNRFCDAIFHAVIVWYYSSLTLQEHILIANGSRIKGWWVLHHYLSILLSGFLLIWPESASYQLFRHQFYYFSVYLSFVQFLQYYYQSGVLYRLRALGISTTMDTTVEGFRWWMFRGLGFLLPFLVVGYLFQIFNAYTLYQISQRPDCLEWQVAAVSALFLLLGSGNLYTLILVLKQKASTSKRITLPCG